MDRSKLLFRKNCEGYLIYKNKLIGRNTEWGYIDFPGGGVEEGETFENALRREALEEAGVIIEDSLKFLGTIKTIWPKDWAKNEKQKKRFEQYQGDEMHFFVGNIKELKNPQGDNEELGWHADERLISTGDAIKILESYRPFPEELKEYYEFKLSNLKIICDNIKL